MKVTAFIGSARKKHTYNATEKFLQKLQSLGNIEYEIVSLSDYNLEIFDILPRLNVVGFWGQTEIASVTTGLTSPNPRVDAPTLNIL